jgi:hypothetical protein
MSEALVPPKPNELDSATLISRLRALSGARSISVSTEGSSRFSVGGATWSRIASTLKIASTAPAAPRRWPVALLVELMVTSPTWLPISRVTAISSSSSPIGVEVPCALT